MGSHCPRARRNFSFEPARRDSATSINGGVFMDQAENGHASPPKIPIPKYKKRSRNVSVMILLLQLVARKGLYGHILSRVVDVRLGQEGFTHDPSAPTSPRQRCWNRDVFRRCP